jgi:YVTN family beta-propeller protein
MADSRSQKLRQRILVAIVSLLVAGTAFGAHRNMRVLRYHSPGLAPGEESMVIHEGLNKIYVADSGSVTVIDGATTDSITTIPIPRQIRTLAVDERANRVYVLVSLVSIQELHIIDAVNDVSLGSVTIPGAPRWIAVDSSRELLLIAHRWTIVNPTRRIDIYDTTGGGLLATFPLPQDPRGLLVDEAAGRAWVLAQSNGSQPGSVLGIDTDALAPVAEIPVGSAAGEMALDPVRGRLYVTNAGDDSLSVLDTVAAAPLATIAVGDVPWPVTVHVPTGKVYVGTRLDLTVEAIDAETLEVVDRIALESRPEDLRAHPTERRVYVAEGRWVRSIDPRSDRIASSVASRVGVELLRVNGPADRVWGARGGVSFGDNTIVIGDKSDKFDPF